MGEERKKDKRRLEKGDIGSSHAVSYKEGGALQMAMSMFILFLFFLFCIFYQFLCVLHSRSSTQSWGSVLPPIVETRDQNSRGCPLPFLNRNLGSFCA